MRRLVLAAALVLVAGCTARDAAPAPPDPCPPTCPGSPSPVPSPSDSDPAEGSAAYDALVVEPEPGELARGGNDEDASVAERTFDVVVPAGARLRTRTVCQGRSSVTVTTVPVSDAVSELPCSEFTPNEVIVEEQEERPADTAYRVTVSAPAPARWYAVLSAATGPPASS